MIIIMLHLYLNFNTSLQHKYQLKYRSKLLLIQNIMLKTLAKYHQKFMMSKNKRLFMNKFIKMLKRREDD
jgi:hypothetical protein